MAIRTGYTRSELAEMVQAVTDQADVLVAGLPNEPLREILLACNCGRCLDPEALLSLRRTPAPELIDALIAQYFSGLGATGTKTNEHARFEARVILTHAIAIIGRWVVLPSGKADRRSGPFSYLSPSGSMQCLFETGVVATLDTELRTEIQNYLSDVVRYCVAKGSPHLDSALCLLSLFGGRVQDIVAEFKVDRPLRHLRFWTALARRHVSADPDDRVNATDLHKWLSEMTLMDREHLLTALEEPEVGRLIERFAFNAKDEAWMLYLSRLLEWREASILATRYSKYANGRP